MIFRHYRGALFAVIISVLGILCYANSMRVPFIFDDITGIQKNPLTTQLTLTPHWQAHLLRFLPYYSFAINYRIGGWDVFGFHLVNVVIHIANAFLVFLLLRLILRIRLPKNKAGVMDIVPFTAAVLFLVHPIQTQAITYISQRLTLMATFFYLASMVLYLEATREKLRLVPFLAALVSMGAAVISKEIAFSLPLSLLTLAIFFPDRRSLRKKVILLLPFFAIPPTVYIIATHSSILGILSIPSGTPSLSRTEYMLTQLNVIPTYIRLLVLPIKQNLDYDYPIARSIFEPHTTASLILILGILAYSMAIFKTNRLAAFGIVFFFIAISVESTLIPITDVINEHRVYLPSVGFFILVSVGYAYILHRLKSARSRNIYYFAFVSTVVLLIFGTVRRNAVWSSEHKLWSDVVAKSPNKVRPRIALGMSLANSNQLQEAAEELRTADILNQKTASLSKEAYTIVIHTYLAEVYVRLNDWENARKQYESLFAFFPNDAGLLEKVALLYLRSGNLDKARTLLQKGIEENPDSETLHFNLGNLYYSEGKIVLAEQEFKNALKLKPNFEEAKRNLQIISASKD